MIIKKKTEDTKEINNKINETNKQDGKAKKI